MKKSKTILIIGASGYIGSHLAEELALDESINIKLFQRKSNDYLSNQLNSTNVEFLYGDFLTYDFDADLRGVDTVYHLVSTTLPETSWNYPENELNGNLEPTIKLLQSCVKNNVSKFVFTSSGGTIYGNSHTAVSETDSTHPFSPYGITKLTIERFLEHYKLKNGLTYTSLRLSNPYGGRQKRGVITTWLKSSLKSEPLKIFGDGKNKRDYIHINNVIYILKKCLNNQLDGIYNVGSGESHSLNEVALTLNNTTKKNCSIIYESKQTHDVLEIHLNISKLQNTLPELKIIKLKDGLKLCWEELNHYTEKNERK